MPSSKSISGGLVIVVAIVAALLIANGLQQPDYGMGYGQGGYGYADYGQGGYNFENDFGGGMHDGNCGYVNGIPVDGCP
jgi:hypothetical protein